MNKYENLRCHIDTLKNESSKKLNFIKNITFCIGQSVQKIENHDSKQ